MKNTLGYNVSITVFGESHGSSIGAVIDGLPSGISVNQDFIKSQLLLRRPVGSISTPRVESDDFRIESGIFNGKTIGTPICIVIHNENIKSSDYEDVRGKARPGHADYTAFEKYGGFEDYRGGGHFSGRVTAGIVAVGAIAIEILKNKGILIGTHILKCADIFDILFDDFNKDIEYLNKQQFAVLDNFALKKMQDKILYAKSQGDSVGGILETAIIGMPTGVGEPIFDSIESSLSHALFSIPAVKGVEFGAGFSITDMYGSQANDAFYFDREIIKTKTNNNGGINGGISNGMPIIFRTAVKPTPTINKEQETVDFINKYNTQISTKGRHDPCIVHRARVVQDSITAIVLCDILSCKYGTDWLRTT